MAISTSTDEKISTDVRLYKHRASYDLPAALSILRESPVIHVAFLAPPKGNMGQTIMNLPLIAAVMRDPEVDEGEVGEDEVNAWAVYLHT
jgi:hypothetical protein